MKLIKQIALVMFALSLSACFSSNAARGTKIDQSQLDQFQRGKTTYNDVVQAVGTPNSSTTLADGSRMAMYSYTTSHSSGAYIPFATHVNVASQNSVVTLRFGPDGILKDYSSTQNNTNMGN